VFALPEGHGVFLGHIPLSGGVHTIRVLTQQGHEKKLAINIAPLGSPNQAGTRLALVLRDISDEEAAKELRTYFLANISHEFRTPLAALKASVELLLDEIQALSRDEIVKLLNSIHFSVTGLQTLIDNLLESTSIEAGHFRIRRRPARMESIVADALQVMQPLLTRRHQTLVSNLPELLPVLRVDPARLTQVLVNLVSNASKYSPLQETIELGVEPIDETLLRVWVADRGPGIAPDDRSNLFRSFVRLSSSEDAQYGIGLGLAVVKTIVDEHGGQVGVEARPGGGSRFWFTVPVDGGTL
jgi:signal transduction histidine kinase